MATTLYECRNAATRILPLPAGAISQIKSSTNITSLIGVILCLVENSLDALSTKVEITVDFRRGGCVVEDNGVGIPSHEFTQDGGLGRMYHTSKHRSDGDTHGTNGSFLAFLAALSLLHVTSRYHKQGSTNTIILHQAKTISRLTPSPISHHLTISPDNGTKVIVRDLFGNMPVRVKQRALAAEVDAEDERSWQALKRGVAALLLASPRPCAIRVRDVNIDSRMLSISGLHPSVSAALTEKSLNALAGKTARFGLLDVLPTLVQIGLAPAGSRASWIPVSASTSVISVRGAICLDPAPTKHCQFVSIGIRPSSATGGYNEIYDTVNRLFMNSSFGTSDNTSEPGEVEKDRRKRDRRYKANGYTNKQLRGRKSVDRWPMFVLQTKLKEVGVKFNGIEDVSDVKLEAITHLLEAMITQWLEENHFRPQKTRRRRNEMQEEPASSCLPGRSSLLPATPDSNFHLPSLKRATTANSSLGSAKRQKLNAAPQRPSSAASPVSESPSRYFNLWSRIKSSSEAFYDDIWQSRKVATALMPVKRTAIVPSEALRRVAYEVPEMAVGGLRPVATSRRQLTAEPNAAVQGATGLPLRPATAPAAIDARLSSEDFGSVDEADMIAAEADLEATVLHGRSTRTAEQIVMLESRDCDDAVEEWTDPISKQVFRFNTRTGVVLPSLSNRGTLSTPLRRRAAITTAVSSAGKPLMLSKRTISAPAPSRNEWLDTFLKDWRNPVFAPQSEPLIPVALLDGSSIELAELATRRCSHHDIMRQFGEAGLGGPIKLSKTALRDAIVIRQIDRKFILCRLPSAKANECGTGGKHTLVLADQHAISERIILEGLLEELCTPVSTSSPAGAFTTNTSSTSAINAKVLKVPLRYQISENEHGMLAQRASHFARWGVLYDLSPPPRIPGESAQASRSEYKLSVCTLPPGIAERCKLSPKLLIELLRTEIWALSDSVIRSKAFMPPVQSDGSEGAEPHPWLGQIGSCPQGITNMLNSRACRSAIMFNDELSNLQCEELVAGLSRCAFPFICAHGRVSMVPLVELGESDGLVAVGRSAALTNYDGGRESFCEAFTKRRRTEADEAS